ncbi:BZ3501_MvSof-1269-A2-R1_Chr12-3g03548 [Microbotryum saponariae]|nr:BZ3501_MvSof-1269-A2-R1_Chr12-2g03533 [Microbotryum saponariae]SDA02335.1 BZ3501_MvSof-1269-A2-R1_Chr12-3g03548 [Microbotryum saponariae]
MARTEHDLGVALDGSFVETTSRSAAQALAQHYASQDGGQTVYYVQARVEPNGKTVYRIRPRSQPTPALASTSEASSGSATASTSQVPAKCSASSEAPAPTIALHTPSPRKPTPRSGFPQRPERYPRQTASDNEGLSPYFKSSTVTALQRSGSQPTLGAARSQSHDGLKSTTTRTASRDQSDVLGRILGWSTSGTAHLGFTPGTETRSNVNDEDKSDLPQDLVDELEGRAPLATPRYREPTPSSGTPFGAGVRLAEGSLHPRSPASDTASPLPVLLLADPPRRREMREVASSDSIRTAKAVDDRLPLPSPHQSRYKDWTAYDLLQNLDTLDPYSLPREPIFRFGRHPAASSASVGSSALDISRTTGQDITVLSTPGDDPRFVIWGVKDRRGHARVASKPSEDSRVNVASSDGGQRRGSIAPAPPVASPVMSSPATASSSSRWSLSQPHHQSESPGTSVRDSFGSQSSIQSPLSSSMTGRSPERVRVLMAATVERLVAELTSKIEVELLASFFLTYRTFLQPVHLLQAFTTRFDWAMQPPSSPADDAARRIVRVRTFVVIRYWLLNHFVLDFYPDRELRTTLTEWLNKRGRDEAIRNNPKDQRLIKGLKKLVRRLKDMHAVLGPTDTIEARAAIARQSTDLPPMPKSPALSDEDVDLDVVPAIGSGPTAPKEFGGAPRDRSRLPTSSAKDKLTTRPTSVIPLPGGQSAVARSINNALGTIGRFKRMLGNRAHAAQASSSSSNPSASAEAVEAVEAVEYEQHDTGDLLWIKDGLDRYLDFHNIPRDVADPEDTSSAEVQPQHVEAGSLQPVAELEGVQLDASESDQAPSITASHESLPLESAPATHVIGCAGPDESASQGRWPSSVSSTDPDFPHKPNTLFFPPSSIPILKPASYNEYDSSRSGCLELDDVDLSDEDDDVVEVKRTLKRLPGAANLRLATSVPREPTAHHRLSTETVSSYGSPCRPSFEGHDRESTMVSWVDDEVSGAEPGVLPGLEGFLLDGLVESDEEEPGDIEAALRRLEGIVDDSRERKKAERVEEQMVKSERKKQGLPWLATASQDGASANGEARDSVSTSASLSVSVEQPVSPTPTNLEAYREIAIVAPSDVVSLNSSNPSQPSDDHPVAASPNHTVSRQLRAVPRKASIGNLLGRTPARASTRAAAGPRGPQASAGPAPPRHRSFLLHCRTEVIAQQFYLIERDMLRVLAWPELVSGAWRDRSQPQIEVLDWEAHLKERRRVEILAKESGDSKSPSAVQAMIARFNLTANWVASEILLTANPDERVALIAKFIRLAFKCYCQSNFQTLTQIIHGLQLHEVERLKKTWARVPSWEMRKFRGMQVFVSHLKNFKHLREVTKALISEYGPPGQRRPLSANDPYRSVKGTKGAPVPLGCIPFLGLFLRDLTMNAELPTFLDPSSTDTPAEVDAEGTLVSLADPNAFNSLAPLPPSLRMRPLVNVHKFRVQARIVQDVLAAMEFAEGYPYDPDARWYLKCLKLRALSSDVMCELSRRLEP